jgi:hypothetical protein
MVPSANTANSLELSVRRLFQLVEELEKGMPARKALATVVSTYHPSADTLRKLEAKLNGRAGQSAKGA